MHALHGYEDLVNDSIDPGTSDATVEVQTPVSPRPSRLQRAESSIGDVTTGMPAMRTRLCAAPEAEFVVKDDPSLLDTRDAVAVLQRQAAQEPPSVDGTVQPACQKGNKLPIKPKETEERAWRNLYLGLMRSG